MARLSLLCLYILATVAPIIIKVVHSFSIATNKLSTTTRLIQARRRKVATLVRSHGTSASSETEDAETTSGERSRVVTVNWSLHEDDAAASQLFDTGRVTFLHHGGNYLPSLHTLVDELVQEFTLTSDDDDDQDLNPLPTRTAVSLDAGAGEKRPELMATLPLTAVDESMQKSLRVGTQLVLSNGLKASVTAVDAENFTIDANPPLAGVKFTADVVLERVEQGPSERRYNYVGGTAADDDDDDGSPYRVATFALGCFWGAELAYQRIPGVVATKVGYTQGRTVNPTYREVCAGTTGHTEAVQVIFNADEVSYGDLVRVALDRLGDDVYKLNQVGNDRGTQYRHGVYYHDDAQKAAAEAVLTPYGDSCQTECLPTTTFFDAEDYHQQYLFKGGQSAKKNDPETIRCYG